MKTNILHAINNLIDNNLYSIEKYKEISYRIRINNMGEALEQLIKDSLCNSFNAEAKERMEVQNKYFSYLGNQNNPPDLIIRGGDALEIKKIEGGESSIALNSSFPKDKLYRNSKFITAACKNCEEGWEEKDICYVIGRIDKTQAIKSLWFVYGSCYAAIPETYERVKEKVANGIEELGIELTDTNEIAKIKKVDLLGITDLRVRGMWSIQHPGKVFEYIAQRTSNSHIRALMLKDKFESFDKEIKAKIRTKCNVLEVRIKDPNNPANLLDAILISYEF